MKLFKTLFNIAALPLCLAKDVVTALPDMSMGKEPMRSTKKQCEQIDEDLG